jgi:hypothetical protein
MNPIKTFEEYLKLGIVKKQKVDKPRALDLIEESERKLEVLNDYIKKIGIDNKNANNIIEDIYSIIIGLVRSKMLLQGFNSSGSGAHEAEISFMKNLGFSEKEVDFANQLRFFRNRILYYGKRFNEEYAEKVVEFLKKIYPKLK